MNRMRWATPEDNAALAELVRACPMDGAFSLYFDRGPDYFALSRLQGEGSRVAVLEGPGGIVGAAAIASFPEVFVGGAVRQAAYTSDLRLHPDARGGRALKRIYDFIGAAAAAEGWDLGFTTVMAGNPAMRAVLEGKGGVMRYRKVATMTNALIQFALPKRRVPGFSVRPAGLGDLPAMVAHWNRLQADKAFAPRWSAEGLMARAGAWPGWALENHRLVFAGERLVAQGLVWDQTAFKRMVVLGYSPEMRRMKRWYNPLSRALGLARIPAPGEHLPYAYLTQVASESPEALRALYTAVYNEQRGPGCLFLSTMLDAKDPLTAAWEGFVTQRVAIELFAQDPHDRYGALEGALAYFDPALV